MTSTDTETIQVILACSEATARHYLSIFDNDLERAAQVVLTYGHDPDWWGHPTNHIRGSEENEERKNDITMPIARTNDSRGEHIRRDEHDGVKTVATNLSDASSSRSDSIPSWHEVLEDHGRLNNGNSIGTEDMETDRQFYDRYSDLVDRFMDAVCHNEQKNHLRTLVLEADAKISCDSGRVVLESNLVNRLSYKHDVLDGRSPLAYAVAKNLYQQVYNLLELGAEINKLMSPFEDAVHCHRRHTALTIAATNPKRDGTEMVRILLSKGADHEDLAKANINEEGLGRGMRYWLDKARRLGVPSPEILKHMSKLPPLDRIHELDFAVVGQESAISTIQKSLAGHLGNRQANRKPLVLLLLGPPGHGKTYFARNTAKSLVGDENFLFVPCQSIRDDADLFGSRLGGSRNGEYSSDGQLTSWLRERQGRKCIVFLDEFEKMKDLTSSLGWNQGKKIYQSFLETWDDGTLSDQSALSGGHNPFNRVASTSSGGNKIDCSQTIWILTSNWGQNEIIDFGDTHKERVHQRIDETHDAWLKHNLVTKILLPLCERNFERVDSHLKALSRRIDAIVPFLPFTIPERRVVADIVLRERLSHYREPCRITGPEEKRRSIGNLRLGWSSAFEKHVARCYRSAQGVSGMLSCVKQADGEFQGLFLRDRLGLTDEQKRCVLSDRLPSGVVAEPCFWLHYDKTVESVTIRQTRPIEVDDEEEDSVGDDGDESESMHERMQNLDLNGTESESRIGAADDAF